MFIFFFFSPLSFYDTEFLINKKKNKQKIFFILVYKLNTPTFTPPVYDSRTVNLASTISHNLFNSTRMFLNAVPFTAETRESKS